MTSLVFSSDGKTLASGSRDSTIRLWDVETGKELRIFHHHPRVNSVSFSSDGKTFASGSDANTIKLWNVKSEEELRTLTGHSGVVMSVSIYSDGKTLASGSGDGTIKLWDVESGKELRTLNGHSAYVNSVSFSSDGKTLASSSGDKKIKLWDVSTGKELCSLIAIAETEWTVTTPEGRFDTNKDLDNIEGVHWIVSDNPLAPASLDIFMRQYYEPNLLSRILKCTADGTCDKEFKPLPPIGEINRVQPRATSPVIRLRAPNR